MNRTTLLTFFLCLTFSLIMAGENQIISPDGKLVVSVSAENGMPVYSITYNGKLFLKKSPLGLKTNTGDFTQGLTLQENVGKRGIDESYELANIKQSNVHYEANEGGVCFFERE